ncbi:hypothetical protein BDN71DRAFT_1177886 [Pleurotus eryngii]|uniref:Uncharacterized protein n=1 Tax=Pleurotus eryngii TaxID=5323 RepID=A0A9P5ZQN1_PLEER|nr:hypothetical protein BDN71DRAFT_1177886 [Pleurotus eryngii]
MSFGNERRYMARQIIWLRNCQNLCGAISDSTTGPTPTEVEWDREMLTHIVPFPSIIEQLFPRVEKLLTDRNVSTVDPWITSIHPYYTSRQLPSGISTEHDSEDYVWHVLVRPSISVAQRLSEKHPWSSKKPYPNLCSCGGAAHIPDGILLGSDAHDVRQVYEVKTEPVLSSSALQEFFHGLTR